MPKQIIAFENTEVSAEKSALEIETMLREHGCSEIGKAFESGRIKSIYFQIKTPEGNMPFTLPVAVEPVYQILYDNKKASPRSRFMDRAAEQKIHDQAERTAWRIIWHWLKSQLALIQTRMANVTQVFMAYMLVSENKTLYEHLSSDGFTALMPGVVTGVVSDAN